MALASCMALTVFALFMTTTMASSLPNGHVVGDSAGWTTGVDYKKWASSQTFYVGEVLLFESKKKGDNVLEVSKVNFVLCKSSSPLARYAARSNLVKLTRPGPYYFITRSGGHCKKGQKLEIQVNSATVGLSFEMSSGAEMRIPVALLSFTLVFCIFVFVGTHALHHLLSVFLSILFF
ncbi:hypothetical protein L6164_029580 [Bauhinia variegata]|uniref:Uncharacterized protein n=1 Tax=Bauhinia variegata TaxID=167791 RepID=A0ACB9LA12_BAUVA|nr:hypothetical protein L6164_029580 [Bauhinia variegata]